MKRDRDLIRELMLKHAARRYRSLWPLDTALPFDQRARLQASGFKVPLHRAATAVALRLALDRALPRAAPARDR